MKNKMLMAAIGGAAMTFWVGQSTATPASPLDDLNNASTFVLLDWDSRVTKSAGGGGVSKFDIKGYDVGGELLGALDASIYATCIEQGQNLRTSGSQWYAVFSGLVGMPSSTQGITGAEENVIANIIGTKFGDDFTVPSVSSARDQDAVKALQSILWEAGGSGDNLGDDDIAGSAVNAGGEILGEEWLKNAPFTGANFVSLFSLISVDRDDASGLFTLVTGQDFVTYTSGEGPGIPVPAPILLTGIGLLGLYRFSRKRD